MRRKGLACRTGQARAGCLGLPLRSRRQLGPHTDEDRIGEETVARLREALDRIEGKLGSRSRGQAQSAHAGAPHVVALVGQISP